MLVGHYDGDHVFGIAPVYNALTANRRNITELLIQEVHLLILLVFLLTHSLTHSLTQGMDVNNKKDDKIAGDIIKIAGTKGIPIREFSRHDLNMMTDNKVLTHSLTFYKNLFDKFSLARCTRGLYYERNHYNLLKWKQWKHVTSSVVC